MMNSEGLGAADLAAIVGNNNDGFGNGNGAWWLLILLIFANNGWGNGYGGNGGSEIQNGFDQAAVMAGINGINAVVNNGFANAEVARCNAIANLTNQINTVAMAQQNCCCENRAAVADLKYTVATENCADRAAISDGIRDIITNQTYSTQRILDQLCADKIDAKNEQIASLQHQLTMANLAASQNAQTATILANNEAQTAALEAYLSPVPRPAYVVQNPNCCGNYYTSGCGCNG